MEQASADLRRRLSRQEPSRHGLAAIRLPQAAQLILSLRYAQLHQLKINAGNSAPHLSRLALACVIRRPAKLSLDMGSKRVAYIELRQLSQMMPTSLPLAAAMRAARQMVVCLQPRGLGRCPSFCAAAALLTMLTLRR